MRPAVMTRSVALCLLLMAVNGCSKPEPKVPAEQVALTQRSPEQVCASADNHQSVKAIIVREAKDEASEASPVDDGVLAGYLEIGPVVVEGVDEATDKVTCSTDLRFSIPAELRGHYVQAAIIANYLQRNGHAAWAASNGVDIGDEIPGPLMQGAGAVPVSFSVQPTADGKSELVSLEGAGGLISAVATAAKALTAYGKASQAEQTMTSAQDSDIPSQLHRPYGVARNALLAEGFLPTKAYGEEPIRACSRAISSEEFVDCEDDIELPEVASCAGSGRAYCEAYWLAKSGRVLKVITVGEPQPGNVDQMEWATQQDLSELPEGWRP